MPGNNYGYVAIAHGAQQTRPAPKRGAQPPRCHSGSVSHSHPRTGQVCSSELDYLKLKKNGVFWLLAFGWCLGRAQPHNPAKPQVSPAVATQRHPRHLSCCSLPRHPFLTPAWCRPAHSSSPPSPTEVVFFSKTRTHAPFFDHAS